MIITVTMNPALDKTIEVDTFYRGKLNRVHPPMEDVGGKGINVSKTINVLGGQSLATGFLGRTGSEKILEHLHQEGIAEEFVLTEGITRTNMKIMEQDGTLTEINEQGAMKVSEETLEELLQKLNQSASKEMLVVLAGSIPRGIDSNIYAHITEQLKQKGARVFVDADGVLLQEALAAAPDFLKPNHIELAEYFGMSTEPSEEQLIHFGKQLLAKGVEALAISRGSKGALFLNRYQTIRCQGLKVDVRSAVGAGDAMVAALAYGIDRGMPWEECIKLSMAVSAAAVTTVGTKAPQKDDIETLLQQVEFEVLS